MTTVHQSGPYELRESERVIQVVDTRTGKVRTSVMPDQEDFATRLRGRFNRMVGEES